MEVARNQALRNLTYAVVDVETTGLSALGGDRICEVAVVVARGGQIVDQFQSLVNPGRPISYGASAVNGISNAMVQNAPHFRTIAPALIDILDGAVLAAHNASFDISFISTELRAAGHEPPSNPVIDTLVLARRNYSFASNKLGNVARSLGIQTRGLHRALADATITWHVLKKFLWDLESQGINTLGTLLQHQGALTPLSGWKMAPPLMEWDGTQSYCPIQGLPPLMEQAVRAHSPLRIRYAGSDGRESERVVHPLKITLREQATYLVAYCHLKHEERTFRLDRIVELRIEGLVG
ncbi:MAG: exonuclease domain-containing protein [Chloroflexota bacterium]